MTGFPSLQEMVQRELARREDAQSIFLPFSFIVRDEPAAITDVAAAVKAIEAQTEAVNCGERVTIASGIRNDVVAALKATHPRRFKKLGNVSILARVIVKPSEAGDIPHRPWRSDVDDDVTERACTRRLAIPRRMVDSAERAVDPTLAAADEPDVVERARSRIAALRDRT